MIDEAAPAPAPPTAPPSAPPAASPTKACANCGAPMHGPFCYACGQPEKGMIRHLASVLSDVADTIFNVDSRIFRSILPLYFRPGYLTEEYFAGRRTRYVTPFRLFFFLCVISFFAIQASIDIGGISDLHLNAPDRDDTSVDSAQTEAQVHERMQRALDGIETAKHVPDMPASTARRLDKAEASVRSKAEQRLAWLATRQQAVAKGEAPPPDPAAKDDEGALSIDGVPWDPVTHPVTVSWLPAFANAKLNEMIGHAKDNVHAARRDPRHLITGLFSVLPQTLFVLMPLFAVLLKVVYLFKRRLYMEHLMVALHSHAFIFLSLLLLAIVHLLIDWCGTHAAAAVPVLKFLRAALWTWLPLYLLLMQKRVYRQGWILTTLKYGLIGTCYLVILSFALAGALVVSLTNT